MITNLNTQNFEKEVKQSKVPVVIDFYADWCGPCQMMKPVFEEASKEYDGKVKFMKLNTEEEPMLASDFGIRGIPTLIVMDRGEEMQRISGFMPKEHLKDFINKTIG